jgi:hypothetical protein
VEDAGEVLAGGVVVEVDLDLDHAEAGAEGVDGHGDLDPEAGGEREEGGEGLPADGALAERGSAMRRPVARAMPRRARPMATPNPPAPCWAGRSAIARSACAGEHRVEQAAEPARRLGQVGVGQQQHRRLGAEPIGDPAHQGGQAGV